MSESGITFRREENLIAEEKIEILREFGVGLEYKFDTFLEEFLFSDDNSFYYIQEEREGEERKVIGFVFLKEREEPKRVYNYYLRREYEAKNNTSRDKILRIIVENFGVTNFSIYSIDYLLLNLLLDYQISIKCTGYAPFTYNFDLNFKNKEFLTEKDERFEMYYLELIEYTPENLEKTAGMIKGDQYFISSVEQLQECMEERIIYYFKNKETNAIVGIGVLENSRVMSECCSIGMFILEEYRKQGFGTLLLLKLQHLALLNGKTVCTSGCEKENRNSRKTIEKSGGILHGTYLEITISL